MEWITHRECKLSRGIKEFKCTRCGKRGSNYVNGATICVECATEKGLCRICNKPLNNK